MLRARPASPVTSSPAPAPLAIAAAPSRDQLLACSAGWLAVSLNLGCQGVGYIYQRRWRAFWIGAVAASAAALALGVGSYALMASQSPSPRGGSLPASEELSIKAAMVGAYAGLLGVGVGSALEAGLAVKRARRRLGQ